MENAVLVEGLVLNVPAEILGPGSEYEKRYIALKNDVLQLVEAARNVKRVTSPDELELANNAGRVLQASAKEVEGFYRPLKQQVDAIKAPLLAHEKEFVSSVEAEKRRLGGLITEYNREVIRKKEEEERKAREEAEKEETEKTLLRAVELESAGDIDAAEQVLNAPIVAAPVVIQREAPLKMAGQVGKTRLVVKVTDPKAIYIAIAEGKLSMECAPINTAWLNKKANLEKQGFDVPGCVVEQESSTYFRV
jgi:hypothetical protein